MKEIFTWANKMVCRVRDEDGDTCSLHGLGDCGMTQSNGGPPQRRTFNSLARTGPEPLFGGSHTAKGDRANSTAVLASILIFITTGFFEMG
jgi:hypothetical protein